MAKDKEVIREEGSQVSQQAKTNVIASMFAISTFKPVKEEYKAFDKGGGGQTRLAQVILELLHNGVKTGLYVMGGYVVQRFTDNEKRNWSLRMQWPSTAATRYDGGTFQPEGAKASNEFEELSQNIVNEFKPWRKNYVSERGIAGIVSTGRDIVVGDAEAKDLGL